MITSSGALAGVSASPERPRAGASLLDAVTDLRRDVARTRFPLPLDGVAEAEDRRRRLLDQLDDHLLPRLRELSAPALVVVAGSTGAGKSTLVNSVLGAEVSTAGVLRPTTRRPVLVHNPADAELLAAHPLLEIVEVVAHGAVPRGLALVDAPDLDSLLESNRATAHRLLEAADLWLFVTTAARYGDALPWEVLDRASERGTSIAMVLNRVPDDALVAVRGDLMARLRSRGMAAVPLFLVPDLGPHEGMIDSRTVAPITRWLAMVGGPDRARSVIARTQRGSLRALRPWVEGLAEAVQAQVDAKAGLTGLVEAVASAGASRAEQDTANLAGGPVRGAWAAGAGGPLASLSTRRGSEARAAALGEVRQALGSTVAVSLAAARRRVELAVVAELQTSDLPGATGLLDRIEASADQIADDGEMSAAASQAWLADAGGHAEALGSGDRAAQRRYARLVRAVGPEGLGTVLAAAAVGLGAARVVLEDALGREPVREPLGLVRSELTGLAADHARAGAWRALAALDGPDLADDAASGLRLRLAVLKGLT